MTVKENLRIEAVYFAKLKSNIKDLKEHALSTDPGKLRDILNNCIEADEALLMCYKNIGDCWNSLSSFIADDRAKIETLSAELDSFKGEINSKIDEVNNYLVSRLSMLEERVTEIETFLLNTTRVRIYYIDDIDTADTGEAILFNWWDDQNANGETIADELNNEGIIPVLIDISEAFISHNIVAFPSSSRFATFTTVFQAIETDYTNGGRYITIYTYELRDDGYVYCCSNTFDYVTLEQNVEISNVLLVAEKQQNNYYRVYNYGDASHNYLDFDTISSMADMKANIRVRVPINNGLGYVELPYSYNDGDFLIFSMYLADAIGDMRCASLSLDRQGINDFIFDYYVV